MATEFFILEADTPAALAEIVTHAARRENKQPLGVPFLIITSDGSAFCLQVLARFGRRIEQRQLALPHHVRPLPFEVTEPSLSIRSNSLGDPVSERASGF